MTARLWKDPEKSLPRAAILVLGVGRSGTSLLAHLLNVLGAKLPEEVLGAGHGNPLGHWEPLRLLELNEEILGVTGRSWYDPRPIAPSWFRSPVAYGYQQRVATEIASSYGDASLILIKEPRICRLAPLYLDALDVLGIEPLVILLIRHPAEVMRSMYERDGGDMLTHELRWLRHLVESEEASRTSTRVWTSLDQVLDNWEATAHSIAQGLGLVWPTEPQEVATEIANVVRKRHRHFRITDDPAPLPVGPLSTRAWQAALYGLNGDEASARALFDEIRLYINELDRLSFPHQECVERRLAEAAEHERQLRETEARRIEDEIARMQQQSETERRGMLSQLGEASVNLSALRTTTRELSDALQRARKDVVDVQSESAEAHVRLDCVEGQFEKLVTSRSWKVTQPLRSFIETVRGVRSGLSGGARQAEIVASSAENSIQSFNVTGGKEEWDRYGKSRLADLLRSKRRIVFPPVRQSRPDVSIILVLFNKSHLSLLCLESILANSEVGFEVVVVDNNSTDETQQLVDRLDGATVIRNERNAGFGPACMQGAAIAKGEYLCFLNNDALLEPGCLSAAVRDLRDDLTVGAVGGKILFADGRLQEAGSIIWNDGSAFGYGRGDNPRLPRYEFRRPVDYCSAALLFTPAQLFQRLGGFSAEFFPAYYEDTDYCTAVWASGRRVIYEPLAVIRHYESASSGDNEAAKPRMTENQLKFREKWRNELSLHSAPGAENVHRARIGAASKALRIVYIDDRVPHRSLGSGFPRSNDIVNHLAGRGHQVVCLSLSYSLDGGGHTDIARDIECVDASGDPVQVCREYVRDADIVWVSRPHNMERVLQWLVAGEIRTGCRLVYDAEAIFACRDKMKAAVRGLEVSGAVMDAWLSRELDLAKAADAVVYVSPRDPSLIAGCGLPNMYIVGHQLELSATPAAFQERKRFLFVGAMHGRDNPNADSMRHFCREVWPIVQASTGTELLIAGYGTDSIREDFSGRGIRVVGPQNDLFPLYNEARVFVVPTRYAAGIPFKAHEAAAHGVPLVVSQLIGEQLEWQNERECVIATDPMQFADACCRLYKDEELWSRIREAALRRVEQDLSEAQFANSIDQVIESVTCRAIPSLTVGQVS